MPYRPSEYPRVGPGKYYYIFYENLEQTRSGKKVWKPRAKRVYISGRLKSWKKGTFVKRSGSRVFGIKFVYENTRKPFKAQRDSTKYSVGRATMDVKKIMELPKNARKVRITDRKSEAQPTLMEVY